MKLLRRKLLLGAALGTTGLVVGIRYGRAPARRWFRTLYPKLATPDAYLRIAKDDRVTLFIPESEMGQGVHTALAQLLGAELGADWEKVDVQQAPTDFERFGHQLTGGSTSVREAYEPLRRAAATARTMLVEEAAERWQVRPEDCTARDGQVHHKKHPPLPFGALAEKAQQRPRPRWPILRTPGSTGFGTPRRVDTAAKVFGTAAFGLDIDRPQRKVAVVARKPWPDAKLVSADEAAARKAPGVVRVGRIPSGVFVLADDTHQAVTARTRLAPKWTGAPAIADDRALTEAMRAAHDQAQAVEHRRTAVDPPADARLVEAEYLVPYLAHAALEPLNCSVVLSDQGCDIWAPTQSPSSAQEEAAKILGRPRSEVRVHTTYLGGGFGRKSQTDFIEEAVHIAKATGDSVKLIYTREDDMQAGAYRPPSHHRARGFVDASGRIAAWHHSVSGPSILRQFGPLRHGTDHTATEGLEALPYHVGHWSLRFASIEGPASMWFWRSVGHSSNAFAKECFMDELAAAAGADPIDFRLAHLKAHPRHRRVLTAVAEAAGWGQAADGRAQGVALHASYGSITAQVAEVSLEGGRPRVHRVVSALDCGPVVHPDIVRAQIQSGIIYGLSAALYGQVAIQNGAPRASNFHDYPVLRFHECPDFETVLLQSDGPLGGVGEPGTPPIAPAVANAVFRLTGKRVRQLPFVAANIL